MQPPTMQTAPRSSKVDSGSFAQIAHTLMRFVFAMRYYKGLVLAVMAAGVLAGAAYYVSATRRFESKAAMLVTQTGPDTLNTSMTGDESMRQLPASDLCGFRSVATHEASMRKHSPRALRALLQVVATGHFLAGDRWKGWKTAARLLHADPRSLRPWMLMTLGILGSRAFGRVMGWKRSRFYKRWLASAACSGSGSVSGRQASAAAEQRRVA